MFVKIRVFLTDLWSQLKKGILQVFSANIINKFVVMISNMVITRMLTKDEYGLWSYVLNIFSYAHLAMGLGLAAGALQFGAENRDKPEENQFYKYCGFMGVFANVPIILVFTIGTITGALSIKEAGFYIRIYLPIVILEFLIEWMTTILRCRNRFSSYSRLITLNTVLVALFTCCGAFFGVIGVIIGKYIAAIISLTLIIIFNRDLVPVIIKAKSITSDQKRKLWHYSILNGISSALNRLLYLIDVSMVAALIKSTADIANYKVATLIPNSLTFIPGSVMLCILPNIVANNKDIIWLRKSVKKTLFCLLLINVFISSILIAFAPWIITIVSGKQYLSSVSPFRVLVLGYCISGTVRSLSVNTLAGLKKVNFNLICSIITCFSDVGLNYLFINMYGMIGAAWATFCVEILVSIMSGSYLLYVLKNRKI